MAAKTAGTFLNASAANADISGSDEALENGHPASTERALRTRLSDAIAGRRSVRQFNPDPRHANKPSLPLDL
jgi:hypothetical protein